MPDPIAPGVYSRQLANRRDGCALFEPDPGEEPAVEVGDVGYVKNGAWVRLFNSSKPLGDSGNDLGTPSEYQPLRIGKIQKRSPLQAKEPIHSESILRVGADVTISASPMLQVGGGFSFQFSKEQGAVLLLGDDADRQDALETGTFANYIRKHHAAWLDFAKRDLGRSIALNDLVLVTGCDKTSAWACASFWGNSSQAVANVSVGQAGIIQGGLSVSWTSSTSACVTIHSGHSSNYKIDQTNDEEGDVVMSGMQNDKVESQSSALRDQCVFVRGYKMLDRKTLSFRRLWAERKLEQDPDGFDLISHKKYRKDVGQDTGTPGSGPNSPGAGPYDSGPGSNDPGPETSGSRDSLSDPSGSKSLAQGTDGGKGKGTYFDAGFDEQADESGFSVSSQSDSLETSSSDCEFDEDLDLYMQLNCYKTPSPLDIILEYILESSTAKLALVHDDDLVALGPNIDLVHNMEDHIRKIMPEVYMDENQVGMLATTYGNSCSDDRGVGHSVLASTAVSTSQNPMAVTTNPHRGQRTPTAAWGALAQESSDESSDGDALIIFKRKHGVKSDRRDFPLSQDLDFLPPYQGGGSNLLTPPSPDTRRSLPSLLVGSNYYRRSHGHASVRSNPSPSRDAIPTVGGVNMFDAYGAVGAEPDTANLNTMNPPRKLVMTKATHDASSAGGKNNRCFPCPVPGCGSTFTRSFNLKGHLRSHNEERPFKCKWPGCEKGFARQHDCKRHEALHLNIRLYTCAGCKKTFARMDALNRHLCSEGGADCAAHEQPLQGMDDQGGGGGRGNPNDDLGPADTGLVAPAAVA